GGAMTHGAPSVPMLPLLKPWYRLAECGDGLVLSYGLSAVVLEGRAVQQLLPAVLPLLDGTRTIDEIAAAVGEPVRPAVEGCLALRAQRGLLTAGPPLRRGLPGPFAETASFFGAVDSLPPAEALGRVAAARIGIVGTGAPPAAIARALRLAGVGVVDPLDWQPAPSELAAPHP